MASAQSQPEAPAQPSQWTSMEQAEFTKALLMRGVPLSPKTGEYDWELFRIRLGSA